MKLYHYALSGHAHRAALFLSLSGLPHELIDVDLAAGQHRRPEFLALNAFGEVPVLEDSGIIIADSLAILLYVARRIGPSHWLPGEPAVEAEIQRWLAVAAGKVAYGLCAARLITVFGAHFDPREVMQRAHATLEVMEHTLERWQWLARTVQPSIADVALYSYTASAPEGNVDLAPYPHVRRWLSCIEQLPRFVPFQQTSAGLRAAVEE